MKKSYKYRIYPNNKQATLINKHIGCCRFIYNLALETKLEAYKKGYNYSSYELIKQITFLKKDLEWLKEPNNTALQQSIIDLEKAFKNFFKSKSGFPKFKSKKSGQSFRIPINFKVDFENSIIKAGKLKNIKTVFDRPFEGKVKSMTFSKTSTGKYFVSILVEDGKEKPKKLYISDVVGVDLGIKEFAILSDGTKVSNPKYLKNDIERLKVLQKRASRKQKGGQNRKKANLRVAKLHERITNRRKDFLHKLTYKLTSENQAICVENLAVSNMMKNHKLGQSISDAGWSEFVRQLEYKCEWRGKHLIKIDRFYPSSKTCSNCGWKNENLELKDRSWICGGCGETHDRDLNAAINIRNAGTGSPGEPVEMSPLGESMKQEYCKTLKSITP